MDKYTTVVKLIWDPNYVAKAELPELEKRLKATVEQHYFPEGIPEWVTVESFTGVRANDLA